MCALFEYYEEVLEITPLNFLDDDVVWIAYNPPGAAGVLGAEAIKLYSCLIIFGCVSEEL